MRAVVFTWLMFYTTIGSVNAQGIDQVFTGNKPLSFGQVLKNTFNLSHYNKSYAVVVGISQYSGGFSNLLSARKDAERMKNFLINEAGFDYVHLLTEEKVTARRLQQIMVDEIPREVKKNDRFLFYWSGHGESVTRNNNTIGYLPFRQSRVGKFGEMLRMTSLKQWDEGLEAKQTLYLLDACFSGLAGFDVKSNVGDQTLKQMAKPSRQILTAGLPHEKTIAGAKFNGSLFTTAVIDGLRGDADLSSRRHPKDGIISMSELALSVCQSAH